MNVGVEAGVGIGFRSELAADIFERRSSIELLEVVAESCFVQPAAWREAVALASMWPVIPHGVKLSLGSAEGIDEDKARLLGRFAREVRSPLVTEHAAFTKSRNQ